MKRETKILVFNVGSSSIKYSLFKEFELLKSGNYERLKNKEDYRDSVEKIFLEITEKIDLIKAGSVKVKIEIVGYKDMNSEALLKHYRNIQIIKLGKILY